MNDIDAKEVLQSYLRILAKKGRTVRSSNELPYTKAAIVIVLEHCLKITNDRDTRETLKAAYISLANFQPLSEEQGSALEIWETDDLGEILSSDKLKKLALEMNQTSEVYKNLQNTILAEMDFLSQKLNQFSDP